MSKIAIFDLDNCLASDSWRLGFIDPRFEGDRKYLGYNIMSAFDEAANVDVVDKYVQQGLTIAIVTARPELIRPMTERWLHENKVRHGHLLMRPEGDERGSPELKVALIKKAFNLADIEVAFDDRYDVLNSYAEIGINAQQLAISNTILLNLP